MSEGLTPEEADRRMKDHPELADEFLNFIHAVFDDLGKEEGEELPELSTVTDVDDIVSVLRKKDPNLWFVQAWERRVGRRVE